MPNQRFRLIAQYNLPHKHSPHKDLIKYWPEKKRIVGIPILGHYEHHCLSQTISTSFLQA